MRPPDVKAPLSGGFSGAEKSKQDRGSEDLTLSHRKVIFPDNLQMCTYVLDRENVALAATLGRETKNIEARALLALWRDSDRFPFVVLGGRMEKRRSGVVGGLALEWGHAIALFVYVQDRFDAIASAQGADFSTAAFLFLTPQRQDELRAIVSARQPTVGAA